MHCSSEPDGIAAGAGALPGARRRCEAGKRTHGPGTRACLAPLAATASHAEGRRGMRVAAYRVADGDDWSLAGNDSALFTIADGFLRLVDPPDYENASDAGNDNVYDVTVRAGDGTTTESIDGATAASYTPTAADADRYLRARATYTDGLGTGKTAQAMAPHLVIARRLSALTSWARDRHLGGRSSRHDRRDKCKTKLDVG